MKKVLFLIAYIYGIQFYFHIYSGGTTWLEQLPIVTNSFNWEEILQLHHLILFLFSTILLATVRVEHPKKNLVVLCYAGVFTGASVYLYMVSYFGADRYAIALLVHTSYHVMEIALYVIIFIYTLAVFKLKLKSRFILLAFNVTFILLSYYIILYDIYGGTV